MDKKKIFGNANATKTILRNVEIKVDKSKTLVKCGDVRNLPSTSSCERIEPDSCRYARPRMNSTKRIIEQMEKWEKMDYKTHKKQSETKEIKHENIAKINEKVVKKMNCHLNERLYKDLVALNLDDKKHRSKSPMRRPTANFPKDIEPKIEDFFEDKNEMDRPIIVPPVKIKLKPVSVYNDRDVYRKRSSWNE